MSDDVWFLLTRGKMSLPLKNDEAGLLVLHMENQIHTFPTARLPMAPSHPTHSSTD